MQKARAKPVALRGLEFATTILLRFDKYTLAAVPKQGRSPTTSRSRRFLFNVECRLLADAQLADNVAVAVRVMRLQVVEQAAALADEHQETAPRGVILLVSLEVLSQLANARTQNRNLDFRRTGVGIVGTEALNQVGFRCRCQHSVLVTPRSPEFRSSNPSQCLSRDYHGLVLQGNHATSVNNPRNPSKSPLPKAE